MFDSILVPTDGSACAESAIEHAEALASRSGATVHVLAVIDPGTLDNAPHLERARDDNEARVTSRCEDLRRSGVDATSVVRTGGPHREILDYAAEAAVDLVVMGTHGRTGLERYVLGSVTEKVVRLSETPVMTVRGGADSIETAPYADVLVPTDGSAHATAAVDVGIDVAGLYDGRLHALSVIDTMALGVDVRSAEIFDAIDASARQAVDDVVAAASEAGVSAVDGEVRYGTVFREINAYVEANDVDLIVMGTHGRSGLERYLLGSVAEKVVRTAAVPVVTVRSGTAGDG
jgi:nucleotide-binding universal stress UspA family protein